MQEILLGTAVFTGLVMVLAFVVLGARTVLWQRGRAQLSVNGERIIECSFGEKLLDALNHGGIHLPTSCSGVGTCGLCRIKISGAMDDDALPIERAHINSHDINAGYRLACQIVVRDDLKISVPQELLGTQTWQCQVKETQTLSPLIKEIVVALPEGCQGSFTAGCYVLVHTPPFKVLYSDIIIKPRFEATWQHMGLRKLKVKSKVPETRAYSVVNRPSEQSTLTLNIRLALPADIGAGVPPGAVSSYLFSLKVGDTVEVSGPYGNFVVKDTKREIIMIGGGVGMAPFYTHIYDQLERLHTERTIDYWYGARSLMDLYYADEMEALALKYDNFSWNPVLSEPMPQDEWDGETGFVHEAAYRSFLQSHPKPQDCEYYLCGPPQMIKAARAMLDNLGVSDDNIVCDDFGV